jgi:acetyl esterase/lipase
MGHDPRAVITRPAPPPDLTVRYGGHPDQVIDLRLPRAGTALRPLMIFIHGGFWRAEWDRAHAAPLAADLAARGWPVATIEYRRTGQQGGGWPGTFDDVAAAVAAARGLDAAAPPGRLPPAAIDRPILAGHSAGGQLALWYAATRATSGGTAPDDVVPPGSATGGVGRVGALRGVLALAPVADLAEAYRLDLDGGAVAALVGGGPDRWPGRFAAVDPMALEPPTVPVTLVHGTRDEQVPVALSRRYAAKAGGRARLVELPGVEHFGLIDPESSAWPAVLDALGAL